MSNEDNSANNGVPKAFISYAWSGKEHQEKVLTLANNLVGTHGVDIVLDEWDLKRGQDKYHFMERCVKDQTITHVLVICDKAYAEKANSREGGVGTETTIITPEIYAHAEQTKFVPVVFECMDDGAPYLPVFLSSRMYFDLSGMRGNYDTELEKLVRHLWGKPLIEKPPLAAMPSWLDGKAKNLSRLRRLVSEYSPDISGYRRREDLILEEYISTVRETWQTTQHVEAEVLYDQIMESKPLQDIFSEFLAQKASSEQKNAGSEIADCLQRINNELKVRNSQNQFALVYNEVAVFLLHELLLRVSSIMTFLEIMKP